MAFLTQLLASLLLLHLSSALLSSGKSPFLQRLNALSIRDHSSPVKRRQVATPEQLRSQEQARAQLSRLDGLLSQMRGFARQQQSDLATPGGVDFSQATRQPDGRLCVIKEESVETLSKEPILECTHKNVEKCHYTYVTVFNPQQEEQCEENFEKSCQITFRPEASSETVRKCYTPKRKICNGQGPQQCRNEYESSCSTRYLEQSPGKFVGDTSCEKLPVEVCGAGCVVEDGPEECHDKQIDTLVDVPEEVCDLNPQKTCRLVTKLVPSLDPKRECTSVPKEVCQLKFTAGSIQKKPLRTEWCLDEEEEGGQAGYSAPGGGFNQPVYQDNSYQESSIPSYSADLYTADLLEQLKRLRRQMGQRDPNLG